MRSVLWLPMACVALLAAIAPAAAAEMKPVAVISFAGYDQIKADIAYVGRISDNPDLDKNLEAVLKLFTRNQGLAGLDKARPWGAVVQTDGEALTGYAFLPVTDLEKLLGVLEPFVGEAKDAGDGVRKFEKGKQPAFFKEISGGWIVVSDKAQTLATAPADPASAVADLNKQYDVAARVYAENIPAQYRAKFFEEFEQSIERDLKRRDSETEQEHATRVKATKMVARSIAQVIKDLDHLTLGWSLDGKAEKAFLDVSVVAKPGSLTAQQAATLEGIKSGFAGFRLPGATVSCLLAGQMPPQKIELAELIVGAVREQALADIAKNDKPEEEKKIGRRLVNDVLGVVEKTVAAGRIDGGMSVLLEPSAVTVVVGKRLVDAAKLDELARLLADIAGQANPNVAGWIKLDAEKWQSITFHTVSIPIPDDAKDRETIVKLVGEKLDVVIGLGKDSLYVALGRDAMSTLKKAIETSAARAGEVVSPLQLSVAIRPIAEFAATVGKKKDRERAAAVAEHLASSAGTDHVNIVAGPIPNGVRYRMEVEPGLVKLLGKLGQMGQP